MFNLDIWVMLDYFYIYDILNIGVIEFKVVFFGVDGLMLMMLVNLLYFKML